MENRNENSFYKSDKEKFREDMMSNEDMQTAYGCVYIGCFFPLLFVFIVGLIALAIWQTKFWLFLALVSLVFILMFQYFMKVSIKGNFDKWKRNGGKL